MVNNKGLISDLVTIIGKEGVSDDIFNRVNYGQDAFGLDLERNKVPIAVVRPESVKQVSKFLEYANRYKIPVYVRGAGTAFKGSSRPKREDSIILSMERFTSFEMHEEDMYFEVGAGVVQLDLERMLVERGYMLPMNVGSKFSGTIGGAVAINKDPEANIFRVAKFGVVGDWKELLPSFTSKIKELLASWEECD